MARKRTIRCQYDPETALRETEQMRPIEELAYRRIVDLIVVCENRLINDDVELARMTKTTGAWVEIKQRLIKNHRVLYIDGTFIRSVRYNETWAAVERSHRQKSDAGKASAAKRAEKNTAQVQPPVRVDPRPVEASTQQPLTDPPAAPVTEPAPIVVEPVPTPGNGAGDGGTIPQDWRPNPEAVAFAVDRGRTPEQIERLVRTYVSRHDQRGDTSKDWNAGFKVWVLRDLAQNPPLDAPQPMSA